MIGLILMNQKLLRIWMNKEDVTMKQIIKFVDKNVDGCGTNVEILIQIEEKNPLSTELVDAAKLPTA